MKGPVRAADREERRAALAAALVEGPAHRILNIIFETHPYRAPEEQQP